MANAVRKMTGPTKIIELDGVPSKNWKIEGNAVLLWKGKLWKKEPVGCVLCVEKEGNEHITLCHSDDHDKDTFHCMEHGELVEVPYSMRKVYTVQIGEVHREGTEELADTMLFPAEMELSARNELIGRLLDEAQSEEVKSGPAPDADDE